MKRETERALDRAKAALEKAKRLVALGMFDIAGRQAYIASLTAARAFIYEKTGNAPKTHKGVKSVMHRLVRDGVSIERALLVALEFGFELKNTADYGEAELVSFDEAKKSMQLAQNLIQRIEQLISD